MKNITPQAVKQTIDNHEPVILLDVRTREEFARGKIAGAINLPVDEVETKIETVIPDKMSKIYIYCLSASRSPIAVEIMENLGYPNVYNMDPGLLGWRAYHYPTVA
jgi:phage shock protein E